MNEALGDAASHFTTEALGERGGAGRYVNVDAITPVEFLPGLGFRPVLGQRAMTNFVSFEPGAEAQAAEASAAGEQEPGGQPGGA